MDISAEYQIKVQGTVPEIWLERLGGMRIINVSTEETILKGRLPDQAALNGVLATLYGLHLPLLEVITLSNSGK